MNLRATIAGTALFIFCLAPAHYARAQQTGATVRQQAPVPVQIAAARTAFISNAGADVVSNDSFRRVGDPNLPYDSFYAAMKSAGRFNLAATPAQADLVMEIRFAAPTVGSGNTAGIQQYFELTIFDAKSRFLLWTIVEPVQGAIRETTFEKNFATGLGALMKDLGDLAGPRPQAAK